MKLSLYYEAEPFTITQRWGVPDPAYKQFGFSRHNGIDIAHGFNSRIRAPFAYQINRTLWQPEGGGLVLSIVSLEKYTFDDGVTCYVLIDYLHLSKYVKTQGQGNTGDLLCIAGNTGFSTGPHTHIQPRRVKKVGSNWVDVDKNDANGSFDPLPYYNGKFAVDYRAPKKPVLVPVEQNSDFDEAPLLATAKDSLAHISMAPEANRSLILLLWQDVMKILSRALTKG